MPINTNLLVSAAILQDYFVDKDTGMPLANGIISLYKDEARSFFKNWYYQTGSPGAYSWIPLDNPLHLSSVGTIQDPNGNDVIPFYYPFEEDNENIPEAYYITVYSSDENGDPAVLQFTRENFPFNAGGISPIVTQPTLENIIVNNVFWRNVGAFNATNVTDKVIAPSQHDGFTNGDTRFLKDVTGATDNLAFLPMTQQIPNDITPETYLNFMCTAPQVGEGVKCIQYPCNLHIATLSNVAATVTIGAQNVAGNPNNYLDIYVYQFLGTGAPSQPPPILIGRIILNNNFQRYQLSFIFPSADPGLGLVLGQGSDDALFIRVQYPLNATFNINHTKTSVYLSTEIPDNDFDTYAKIASITDSARTGDVKPSYNFNGAFPVPGGWVGMNDGSIGTAASNASARANADTFPLYNLLWNSVGNAYCPTFLAGVPSPRGANAYADFIANKVLFIPKQLARVIAGADPILVNFTKYFVRNVNQLVVDDTAPFYTGTPVVFTSTGTVPPILPAPIVVLTTYYLIIVDATNVAVATTLDNALAGIAIVLTTNGSGLMNFTAQLATHPLGSYVGQDAHNQLVAEMAAHSHALNPNGTLLSVVSPGSGSGAIKALVNNDNTGNVFDSLLFGGTENAGGDTPFNILQPTVYANFLIKL